jgi:hypothetical protein
MDSRQTEPKNPTVREIVGAWLTAHGYSGLYWDDCGCAVDELMHCGECDVSLCRAGYRVPNPKWPDDYYIVPEKPTDEEGR